MSRSNNNDIPRIAPEEYEPYKKWLEAREAQAPSNHDIGDDSKTSAPSCRSSYSINQKSPNNGQARPDDITTPGPSGTPTDETLEDQCSAESSKSAADQRSGLRIVGTSKIKLARLVKQIAPSDRKLQTRG
ncbi:hypothetical protein RhiJN_15420 [Ceratobasidium sp. AG-Ba]|nr:hypothetical protein RhiJN_15420 [Ceratobasidium sp. AG-Ba]